VSVAPGAVVFSDIVGFTELTELHGDDAALEVVETHSRLVHDVLPDDARIVKELGDGVLLWFDRAGAAVEATLALQDRVAEHAADPLPMWVRVGVHWGSPKRRGDDLIGRDVNLASRIAGLAGPREVVCTAVAAQAAGDVNGVSFVALGAVFVRGVPDPVPLVRAQRASANI
jgi:adenylate cyclase